jgi:hypothetical protein
LLPYKYLLAVLTRLFAHHPDLGERDLLLVRRWFWRAAVVGPEIFRGNTTGAVRVQNRAVQPGDPEGSIQRLIQLIPRSTARVPDLKRFRSNEAATKLVLCSWWSIGPKSLGSGKQFDSADLAESIGVGRTPVDAVQNVISRASVPRDLSTWAANRVLYPATDPDDLIAVESILVFAPKRDLLISETWEEALASHSITMDMATLYTGGDTVGFLARRQEALEAQLDTFLRQRCEWEFEDTPSLDSLVMDDEDEARDLSDDESSQY